MKRLLHHLVFATTLTAIALPPTLANAALNAYLDAKFQTQGKIKGSVVKKGQAGKVRIIAVTHEIVSPRDAASGLATGKRQHKPITLTMELGSWAPQFNMALVNNENIATLDLAIMDAGDKEVAYTIGLQNARVSRVALKGGGDDKPTIEVSFVYEKITWTWADGSITAQDDWETPMVGAGAPPKPPKKPK